MSDRALWVAAQDDYKNALAIALKVLRERQAEDGDLPELDWPAIQAAAATVLIHFNKMASSDRLHVKVPSAAATDGGRSTVSAGGTPSCPQCGGAMEPNRNKKSEKAPDFVCLQENGPCGKRSKDGKYFNKTGKWIEPVNPKGAKGNAQPVAAGGYDDPPPGIAPEDDDLPF